ncbi:MAG: DUF4249 family protein [Bacteroidia bacterium]|jgi:hypothetical protein
MKKLHIYICCLIIGILTSCEKYETIDADLSFESKLVVSALLKEGETDIVVNVSRTTPLIGTEPRTEMGSIPDALVYLTGPHGELQLVFDSMEMLYKGSLSGNGIESGATYFIAVSHNGEKVTGSTTVPVQYETVSTMKWDSTMESGFQEYSAHLSCKNLSQGYPMIMLYPFIVYSDSSRYPMLYGSLSRIRKLAYQQTLEQQFTSMFTAEFVYPVRVELITLVYDEAYSSYYNQVFDLTMGGASGNPFAEPSIVKSNMSNGIGIFGSSKIIGWESFPLN